MKLRIKGNSNYNELTTIVTIKDISNADEDDNFLFEYDSDDSKSLSKKFPLVNNFKSAKAEVEKDIKHMFEELKNSVLNK